MSDHFMGRNWFWIGSLIGISTFLIGTATMGGIYRRPTTDGSLSFSFRGLWEYLKAPFQIGTAQFYSVWAIVPGANLIERLKLLQLNWVAMLIAGALLTYLGKFFF